MSLRAFGFAVPALLLARVLFAEENPADDFDQRARDLRAKALGAIEPKKIIPQSGKAPGSSRHPWRANIVTVLFHVGEGGDTASAWDAKRAENFGGFDNPDPAARRHFLPVAFIPRQNPFYCALPYNDLAGGRHKPEARTVIPWFAQAFEAAGQSVCLNRWIAIRKENRICYAQWSDVGPHRSDQWEYVFGNERPKPNANRGAGLSVSPAVRDYLGMNNTDVTDWKFVERRDVPPGPWVRIGENNAAIQGPRRGDGPSVETR